MPERGVPIEGKHPRRSRTHESIQMFLALWELAWLTLHRSFTQSVASISISISAGSQESNHVNRRSWAGLKGAVFFPLVL